MKKQMNYSYMQSDVEMSQYFTDERFFFFQVQEKLRVYGNSK